MDTRRKLRIADDVFVGKKIKATADSWGVSASTVRRYLDDYVKNQQKAYSEYVAREQANVYPCQYIKTFEEFKKTELF